MSQEKQASSTFLSSQNLEIYRNLVGSVRYDAHKNMRFLYAQDAQEIKLVPNRTVTHNNILRFRFSFMPQEIIDYFASDAFTIAEPKIPTTVYFHHRESSPNISNFIQETMIEMKFNEKGEVVEQMFHIPMIVVVSEKNEIDFPKTNKLLYEIVTYILLEAHFKNDSLDTTRWDKKSKKDKRTVRRVLASLNDKDMNGQRHTLVFYSDKGRVLIKNRATFVYNEKTRVETIAKNTETGDEYLSEESHKRLKDMFTEFNTKYGEIYRRLCNNFKQKDFNPFSLKSILNREHFVQTQSQVLIKLKNEQGKNVLSDELRDATDAGIVSFMEKSHTRLVAALQTSETHFEILTAYARIRKISTPVIDEYCMQNKISEDECLENYGTYGFYPEVDFSLSFINEKGQKEKVVIPLLECDSNDEVVSGLKEGEIQKINDLLGNYSGAHGSFWEKSFSELTESVLPELMVEGLIEVFSKENSEEEPLKEDTLPKTSMPSDDEDTDGF